MSDNIYLKLATNSTRVILVHYNPFDPKIGLMISSDGGNAAVARTRLLKTGVFVDSIPEPPQNSGKYRYVLNYISGTGCTYVPESVPSGDTILLDTLESAISSIKSIIPTSKLLINTGTVAVNNFDISELLTANPSFGIAVNKNGTFLKSGLDYIINKSGNTTSINIYSGIESTDYAIVMACDNLSNHTHDIYEINNLTQTLAGKASLSHTHAITDIYVTSTQTLSQKLDTFALKSHTHTLADLTGDYVGKENYYGLLKITNSYNGSSTTTAVSQLGVTNGLATKSNVGHTHPYLPEANPIVYDTMTFRSSTATSAGIGGDFYLGTKMPSSTARLNYDGYFYATKIFNAVYGDFAECFNLSIGLTYDDCKYRILEYNKGKVYLASSLSTKVIGIGSTEFGYLLSGTAEDIENNIKVPVGLSGTLWVDSEFTVDEINVGKFICSGNNGKAIIAMNTNENSYSGTIVGKIIDLDKYTNRYRVLLMLR
jgi:hypothetical protein